MKFALSVFLFFIPYTFLQAQSPIVEWQKCFGGSDSERPGSSIQLADSNYIVVGSTGSNDGDVSGNHGVQDVWIAKFDQIGNIIWQKCIGGSYNDFGMRIFNTSNNNIFIVGVSGSFDGDVSGNHSAISHYDIWGIMLDDQGNMLWQKCYGGSGDEFAYKVIETSDSSLLLAGSTTSNDFDVSGNHSQDTLDVWVIKIDMSGNLIWQKCLGGTNDDKAYSICQAYDGGYLIIGSTMSNNGDVNDLHDSIGNYADIWLMKISSVGVLESERTLGGSATDIGWDVQQDFNFTYTLIGHTTSFDGDINSNHSTNYTYDVWMANIDSTGNILWQKNFGGSASDFGYSFIKTNQGYLISGETISIDGDVSGLHTQNGPDLWVFGIDSLRNLLWQKCYGGTDDELYSSTLNSLDGGFLISAMSQSNNGDVSGHHNPNYASDFWLLKISEPYVSVSEETTNLFLLSSYFKDDENLHLVFNSNDNETFNIQLMDITGKTFLKSTFDSSVGKNEFDIPIKNLIKGIYIVRLQFKNKIFTSKVVY